MPTPKFAIFDWDNTLVDNWGAITQAMNATRSAFDMHSWSEQEARANCSLALRDSFPQWFGGEWPRARDIFYDAYQKKHLENVNVMQGACSVLDWFAERAVPLFIVSNKIGKSLRSEVELLGWSNRFEAIVGSLDAAKDKPSRDPVDWALSHIDAQADDERILFIGDSEVDVACARASGCTPVLVHKNADPAKLGVELSFETLGLFEEWLVHTSSP